MIYAHAYGAPPMTPKRLQFARQLAGKSCSDLPRFDLRLEVMSSFRSARDVGASRSSQRIREVNELRAHFSLARRPSLGLRWYHYDGSGG